jgi:hypothetical protein
MIEVDRRFSLSSDCQKEGEQSASEEERKKEKEVHHLVS